MIITISGKAGSGKGTVSKILAKRLWYERISVWDMKRKLAEKMWLSIFEFNKLWDKLWNERKFDLKYDEYQANLDIDSNIILDARLWFYNQPDAFKVFLDVDDFEWAKRIMQDDRNTDQYSSIDEFVTISRERNKTDSDRYKKLYGVDHLNLTNFDFVVDTTNFLPDVVADKILIAFGEFKN